MGATSRAPAGAVLRCRGLHIPVGAVLPGRPAGTGSADRQSPGGRRRHLAAAVLAALARTGSGRRGAGRGPSTLATAAALRGTSALTRCGSRPRRRTGSISAGAAMLAAPAPTGSRNSLRSRWLRVPLIAAVSGMLMLNGCGDSLRQHEFAAMSTVVRATVYGRSPDWEAFERAALAYAARYDHRDPASPVARLNRDGAGEIDPLTAATLSRAVQLAEASGGAFDPTMLPVTRLWDFDHGGALPGEAALRAALARVDYRRLQVTGGAATLRDAELDLGAIGKGAVVDHLADWLAERGYRRFLLEAGGDVLVSGLKPDGAQWRIWIRHPRSADAPLAIATIGAAGERVALATSGDYERFMERGGVRYHHILNPATGRPDSDAVSVSVIAGSAIEADALATALFVLGSGGEKLLRGYPGIEGVIMYRSGDQLAAVVSERFPALHGRINVN